MCGILGGINTTFNEKSLARLDHRGPDQAAFATQVIPGGGTVELGQTRLNIVDRHDICLPVTIGDATILLNGEIYNFPELKRELETLGWRFQTRTDTEVALASYLQWGPDCLARFNGMFALAIWHDQQLFCARDRMGQKPLFCRQSPGRFEFASEVKAFNDLQLVPKEIFDLFEFVFNDCTIYKDVFSIKPGHYLIYDLRKGTWHTRSYWDIEHQAGARITHPRLAVDEFIGLMEDAVGLRMRADVDVTLLLSGGIDSSLLARLSGVQEAFTCQFDEFRGLVNEEHYASDLARSLGIRLHVVQPTKTQFLEDLPEMGYHLEMPTGSFSVFPLYRLAKACRAQGYKVVLSGEGADELFAGYARSAFLLEDESSVRDDRAAHYASMLGRYRGSKLDRFCRMASRSGLAGAAMMKMYLMNAWSERRTPLENICYVESRIFLQPLLQMSDRMCMAHGVEARCPFLDHRVIEFAFRLDDSLRFREGTGKWVVQEAARRLLPKNALVLDRAVKDGLPAPINLWMHGQHSFDRKYWNTLMMAECMKALLTHRPATVKTRSALRGNVEATSTESMTTPAHAGHEVTAI